MDIQVEPTTQCMLSTIDNPFDPFDQWDDWYAYDYRHGYHSPGLLARIAIVSDEMSDEDVGLTIEQAIDEIVKENVSGLHIKVVKRNDDQSSSSNSTIDDENEDDELDDL